MLHSSAGLWHVTCTPPLDRRRWSAVSGCAVESNHLFFTPPLRKSPSLHSITTTTRSSFSPAPDPLLIHPFDAHHCCGYRRSACSSRNPIHALRNPPPLVLAVSANTEPGVQGTNRLTVSESPITHKCLRGRVIATICHQRKQIMPAQPSHHSAFASPRGSLPLPRRYCALD